MFLFYFFNKLQFGMSYLLGRLEIAKLLLGRALHRALVLATKIKEFFKSLNTIYFKHIKMSLYCWFYSSNPLP